MNNYTHLTAKDREKIWILKEQGYKQEAIAKRIGKNQSTISRELKRNSSILYTHLNNHPDKEKYKEYFPYKAQKKYEKRRKKSKTPFPLKRAKLYKYVLQKLEEGWSPDSISGRAKIDNIGNISHECIYQFIYSKKGKEMNLCELLRRRHKKRRKWKGRKGKRYLIPNRASISQRSKNVEKRKEFGHWEGDSIIGHKRRSALHTEIERKTRYLEIRKIDRKTAINTKQAMIDIFKNKPQKSKRTTTLDNGSEFTKHTEVSKNTKIKIYFAHPFCSYERGSNENANGMIRWYLPKGTNFDDISDLQLQAIQFAINNRPRKSLNYKTPYELYMNELNKISHHKIKY